MQTAELSVRNKVPEHSHHYCNPFCIYESRRFTAGESLPSALLYVFNVEKRAFWQNQNRLLLVCFDPEINNLVVVRIMYSSPSDNTGLNCVGSLACESFPNDLSSSNLCCSRVNSEAGNPRVQLYSGFSLCGALCP